MLTLGNIGSITDVRNGESWTPREFQLHIARRKSLLEAHGVRKQSRLVIAHGNTPAFFADLFACWSLGACCICINPSLTKGEMETVVEFIQPLLVLVSRNQHPATGNLQVPVIDTTESTSITSDLPETILPDNNEPALILFTSGTTGNPKGVVHTAASISARIKHNRRHISDAILQRTLCILPTHFGHGLIGNCLTPLFSSGHLFLYPNPGIQGTSQIVEILSDNKITFMSSVPAFWKMALKTTTPPGQLDLQQVNIGSAPLSAELWRAVASWAGTNNVNNMYGITETANWAAGASSRDFEPEDGLAGNMWGGEAAIVAEDGSLQKSGTGEIVLKTPSLMTGYYHRPDYTADVLKNGWYYTGDHGSIDESGTIRLQGRIKTEINRAGTKILPEELDLLMEKHPHVAEACTFGIPDPVNGEMVAIAIRSTDHELKPAELRSWCAERIRPECVPEKWFMIDEIPKTDRGKINRAIVRDTCLNKAKHS